MQMRKLALAFTLFALSLTGGSAPAADFHLQILDPQAAAVAGATVEIRAAHAPGRPIIVVSDASGSVQASFEPPAEIRVTATGFDPLVQRQETAAEGLLTLVLRPATLRTTVNVVVRDIPAPGTSPTSVGSALEIDRAGARTVFDAVEKLVPSAFVTRRGVMGYGIATNGTGIVTIRGVGESPNTGVLVVLDGRPDYMGLMGHPLPDFYSLSDAESVTVTQGPASVLYGSNAMGGAIEIKPSRPRDGVHTQITSTLGSFYTGQDRLSHGTRFARGFYSLTGGVYHTQGDRPNSAFHSQDGTLALGYDISPVWRASLQGRYGHFNVEDPGPELAPAAGQYARVGRGGFSVDVDNATTRTWGYARFFSSYGRHMIWDGFRSIDHTTGARVHQNFALTPRLAVDGGADLVSYGGRANNIKSLADFGEHDLRDAAGFSRTTWVPLSRLRLNAGLRYQHNSLYGGIAVPEFGVSYQLADKYAVSAAVARGFRNPTIRELYLFPAPNPNLRPEHVWNCQATIHARPRPGFSAWVTGYYADLSNLIVTTGRFPNLQLSNLGRALNRGVEANVRWQPARRVGFNSGYAYLRSSNLGPYIPSHKLNYSLDLDAGRAYIHFGGMTVGPRWADIQRTWQLAGFTVASLKFTIPVRRNFSVFGLVDNLFNRHYEVVTGYPMPGVNALGGIDIHF
jgi:outer membrane receptor protein involved in Fe transport